MSSPSLDDVCRNLVRLVDAPSVEGDPQFWIWRDEMYKRWTGFDYASLLSDAALRAKRRLRLRRYLWKAVTR